MTAPVVLVLDDVHLLQHSECRAALSVLAEHVPGGSRLVLAGRDVPPVRVGRLRAGGKITEIGAADLSLTVGEAGSLLRAAEVVLADDDLAALHQRTEGWPAGSDLAALYLREGGSLPGAAASFGGDDRFVSEYLESEFLARISRSQRVFLTRTAVLERMSGPLCEAVLELPGSGAILADLAGSNLLLVPLDHRGQWYRYHHLFRDMLLAELERLEPGLVPVLRRRAAGGYLRHDSPEEALEYSMAAGDVETAARLMENLALPAYRQGRTTTARRWLQWLADRDAIEGRPVAAVWAAIFAGRAGQPAEAERWPMPLIAGNTVTRRGPLTLAPRGGPPCCGPSWPGTGSSRCAPTLMRPRGGSRRQASWRQWPPSCEGSHASFAAISTTATFTSRMPSPSGKAAHLMSWRTRCASGRWWRWLVTSGARPRSLPAARARSCAGPANRTLTRRCARCEPVSPCTGETSRQPARNSSRLNGSGLA